MDDKRQRFEAQALPHLDSAYNLARWLARSQVDADDVVQEAMLRAYRGFDSVRGHDVKPWLLAIVRNCFLTAASQGRRGASQPLPKDDAEDGAAAIPDEAPNPEVSAIRADHSRKLSRVISSLPQEFREVLVLREMEDLSYGDIAQVTRIPIGTVMSRLARARSMLRDKWMDEVEGARHGMS